MRVAVQFQSWVYDHRTHYSEAQLGAFLGIAFILGRTEEPGWFAGTVGALRRALPRMFAKHVDFLVEQGDLIEGKAGVKPAVWIKLEDVVYHAHDEADDALGKRASEAERARAYRARKRAARVTPKRVTKCDASRDASRDGRDEKRDASRAKRDAKRDARRDASVTAAAPSCASRGTGTPIPPSSLRGEKEDISGDIRVREERAPEKTPDQLAELLLSKGMFDLHPRPEIACGNAAEKVRRWGRGFEDVGELWDRLKATVDNPRRVLGWALKDEGKWKVVETKAGTQRAPTGDVGALCASLAGRFAFGGGAS